MKIDLNIGERYVIKKGSTYAYWSDPAIAPNRYFYYSTMWNHKIVKIENIEIIDENFSKVHFTNLSDSTSDREYETTFYDDTKIVIPDMLRFLEGGSKEPKELFLKITKLRDIFVPITNKLIVYLNRINSIENANLMRTNRLQQNFNEMLDDQYYKSLRKNDYENAMTTIVKEMENKPKTE